MYYVIQSSGVVSGRSVSSINRKLETEFSHEDFKPIGNDLVVKVEENDLSFLRDMKRISQIPMQKLYKTDNTVVLVILNLVLTFFVLVRG